MGESPMTPSAGSLPQELDAPRPEFLGVDVGGTFTDFVLAGADGRVRLHKRLTTPSDPAISFLEGVAELGLGAKAEVIHGSTVATNALLERRGARTALVATRGFADVIEIGRQNRPDLYALVPVRPPPLVPRGRRFEVDERVTADGGVAVPLDPDSIQDVAAQLRAEQIESVAVCLLFSFLRPEHEQQVRERLAAAGFSYVSISSDILPEYREYERAATTVINAYVTPLIDRYLLGLETGLSGRPLHIMQSNGGTISARTARSQAARTALSGPAGGVVGAFEIARQSRASADGTARAITFDMGGTSTDVALCPGHVPLTAEGEIGGMPLRLPMIDVHTVGAGGGSLARLDAGGALVVGPESAGADPGPVCYGRGGTLPTVTDANLVLGRLEAGHFLGGRMRLDLDAARSALGALAREAGAESPEAAAWDVIQVADATMERAIRRISVERGHDPREFTLVAFGGAGPLHACQLADRLGIPRVLVPRVPGVLSALGMLIADRVKDYSLTVLSRASAPTGRFDSDQLAGWFAPLESRARREMSAEGVSGVNLERSVDMRYRGQSYEINVPAGDGDVLTRFHGLHAQRYGHAHPGDPVELVAVRLRAIGRTVKPRFEELPARGAGALPRLGSRELWFETVAGPARLATNLYTRESLRSGDAIRGPALIVQLDATTLVPPGWIGEVDRLGSMNLSRQSAGVPEPTAA